MSLVAKLIVSLVIAMVVATLTTVLRTGEIFDLQLLVAFFIATTATALSVSSKNAPANTHAKKNIHSPATQGGNREQGTVKWFNTSKGFGFIVKEDGEEIFVHFRSIRGEGRRSLRDGQRVSFIVADSNKGPQAEDVVDED